MGEKQMTHIPKTKIQIKSNQVKPKKKSSLRAIAWQSQNLECTQKVIYIFNKQKIVKLHIKKGQKDEKKYKRLL